MTISMHKDHRGQVLVADCEEPEDVQKALSEFVDKGLHILSVQPYKPIPTANSSYHGDKFIVIAIPERRY